MLLVFRGNVRLALLAAGALLWAPYAADGADGVPPVSETYLLRTGDPGASPYDAPPGEYACEPTRLIVNRTCAVTGRNSSILATRHPIEDTRASAPDKWRRVIGARGDPKTLPAPWANGDRLARSPTEVSASERVYVLAFEMLAVMRNWMFFNASGIDDERWAHLHRPLTDCGLEGTAAFEAGARHASGRRLDRHGVLRMMRVPWWHGGDIAPQLEHYAAAVQADFLCVVAPELAHAPEHARWEHRDRCVDIRRALGLSRGVMPTCWFTAYRHFYNDGGLDWPFNHDWAYAQPGGSKPKEWTLQMKNAGVGYTTMWPETEARGLSTFGRPAFPGTTSGQDVPNKEPPPYANPLLTGTGPLTTGDHTHDSTRAGGGSGGNGRPPGGAFGADLSSRELSEALEREARYENPSMEPIGRPRVARFSPPREEDAGADVEVGAGVMAGAVVTERVSVSNPSWPARVSYGAWRQARGTSEEQAARLLWACEDVRQAAEILGVGGSCGVTRSGTVAGTVEGSAAAVFRMATWLKSSFHWCELGVGPILLGAGDIPQAPPFRAPPLE